MIEKEKQKRQQLNDENLKLKEKIEELQKYIQQIEAETQKSKQIIKEADMEQKKMQKALEQVKNDRVRFYYLSYLQGIGHIRNSVDSEKRRACTSLRENQDTTERSK